MAAFFKDLETVLRIGLEIAPLTHDLALRSPPCMGKINYKIARGGVSSSVIFGISRVLPNSLDSMVELCSTRNSSLNRSLNLGNSRKKLGWVR